ncbi:MAG: OsmC family protein [Planctomycetota bacterium]
MSDTLHTASAVTGVEGYQTSVEIGSEPMFRQTSDASAADGGKDLGASPVAQLTGALASCKSITGRMYAERKGWPLESIRVDVRHVRKDVDGKPRDVFETTLTLKGDLDDDQRKRIEDIAGRCPVSRMIQGETIVESSLGD